MDDYHDEKRFAIDFLQGKNTDISEFPYYDSYIHTIEHEKPYLKSNILFIGSGSFPLSPILYTHKGFKCDGLDYSKNAVIISTLLLKKINLSDKIKIIHGDARVFKNFANYNTIIVSLEAGVNDSVKNRIFANIIKQINDETVIIVRSSNSELFVNSSKYITNYFSIIDRVDIFDGYSSSFILKKKNENGNT